MRNRLSFKKVTGSILFVLFTFLTLSSYAQVQERANKVRRRDRYVPRAHNYPMQADLARSRGPRPGTVINGYYPDWATYDGFNVKNLVTSNTARKLTHLTYAFGAVANNQCALTDIYADIQQAFTADTSVNGRDDSAAPMALHGNFQQLAEVFGAGRVAPNMTTAKWRQATKEARAVCKSALADLKRHKKEHGC